MALTINSLETGLAVLANPLVNVEHDGKNLFVNTLLKAPEIISKQSFCVVEYLTPVKFKISNSCYVRPVKHKRLALVTCANLKKIVIENPQHRKPIT